MEPEVTPEETASYTIIEFPGSEIPEAYKGLIYSRWLRSHRYGNFINKMIPSRIYYVQYGLTADYFLNKLMSTVRLAVLSDDHDVVLGFAVSRPGILDYVHVHHVQRDQRIAWNLVPKEIRYITHWTYMGERFATKRYGGFVFNPYA